MMADAKSSETECFFFLRTDFLLDVVDKRELYSQERRLHFCVYHGVVLRFGSATLYLTAVRT